MSPICHDYLALLCAKYAGIEECAALRRRPLQQQLANLECNAVCAVAITHHFLTRMVSCMLAACVAPFNACEWP